MPIKEDTIQESLAGRKHPVPQNVMDVEFKVIGDLTLRQVFYIAAGAVAAYLFYKTGIPTFWKYILMFLSGALGVAVAFVPIEERGLDKWLVIFINSIVTPTQRIWRKSMSASSVSFLSNYEQLQILKSEMISLTPIKNRNRLEEYLGMIENKSSTTYDTLEDNRIKEIQQSLQTSKTTVRAYESSTIVDTPVLETPILEVPSIDEKDWSSKPEKNMPVDEMPINMREIMKDELDSKNELVNLINSTEEGYNQEGPIEVFTQQKIDRPMSNLPGLGDQPSEKGEIKLEDIRRIPPVIVAEDIKSMHEKEETLEKKVSELLELAKKARSQYQIKTGKPVKKKAEVSDVKAKYNELEAANEKLAEEISKSTKQIEMIDGTNNSKIKLENQIENLTHKSDNLDNVLKEINAELDALKKNESQPNPQIEPVETKNEQEQSAAKQQKNSNSVNPFTLNQVKKAAPKDSKLQPNIIEGTIKNLEGNLIEGAAIIIKDKEGNVLRALKTNQFGQFRIQTPVPNGKYTVEILKGGMSFDIIVVEAIGKVINPIYLVARTEK